MAIKITNTITTYSCPSCNAIVRKKNDGWILIYVLLFIPIGLIALIVHLINRKAKRHTIAGEEIIKCPSCSKVIVLGSHMTRLLVTQEDILNTVMPLLRILADNKISSQRVHYQNEEFSERLCLRFTNTINQKTCDATLYFAINTIFVVVDGEKFDINKKDFVASISGIVR